MDTNGRIRARVLDGQGARRLDLMFGRVDGMTQVVRVGTARASRDARHLGRVLQERVREVDRRSWLFRRSDGADLATGDLSWFLHGLF